MVNRKEFQEFKAKPRVFVVSDISNEPDDAESLDIETIVQGYAQVVANLNAHVHPSNAFPDAQNLLALIKSGPTVYGKVALRPDVPLSEGTKFLIDVLDESAEPLWVLCWGGTNVLAQALFYIHQTRPAQDCAQLRAKLRVYAISDQDDTGLWIRTTYPDVFYICSIHGWSQYSRATWTGISGLTDIGGSDPDIISKEWLKEHIQIGPLGQCYPNYKFLVEGDTPTFLYLIQNGLGSPEHPEWGSWGGRYDPIDLSMAAKHYSDTVDTVIGKDGKQYSSNYATIWRWREAYQHDFAARIQWTLTNEPSKANHAPVVSVNDDGGNPEPLLLEVECGEKVFLDASKSFDPDGDELSFDWFHYKEPSTCTGLIAGPFQIPEVEIKNVDPQVPGRKVEITVPSAEECGIEPQSGEPVQKGQVFHFVLQVKDNGTPSLTTYKRIVIQATNTQLRGRRGVVLNTTADWLEYYNVKF